MALASRYHFSYLISYAKRVKENVEMVELDLISKTLAEFPEVIKRISALIKQ